MQKMMLHKLLFASALIGVGLSLQCVGVCAGGRRGVVADQAGGQRVAARPHVVYVLTDNLGWGGVGFLRAMSPTGPSREVKN